MDRRTSEGLLYLLLAALVIAVSWSLTGCGTAPQAPKRLLTEPDCLAYSPPLLFDTSANHDARPDVLRVRGVELVHRAGVPHLLFSTGNELQLRSIADPLHPGGGGGSRWSWITGGPLGPWADDRDYNLAGFDICDDCRYGIAGWAEKGTLLWDSGADGKRFYPFHHYATSPGVGGVTFMLGGQQYLVAAGLPGAGCGSTAALWRIDGVEALSEPQCLRAGTRSIEVTGGRLLTDATGSYLWLADGNRELHVFRVLSGGAAEYVSTPGYATMIRGAGISADLGAGYVATAAASIWLWDVGECDDGSLRRSGSDTLPRNADVPHAGRFHIGAAGDDSAARTAMGVLPEDGVGRGALRHLQGKTDEGTPARSDRGFAPRSGATHSPEASLGNPILIGSWRPGGRQYSLVALSWPYLWASTVGGPPVVLDVSRSPAVEVSWPTGYPGDLYGVLDEGAVFSDEGDYLFATRYSVLERLSVCEPAPPEPPAAIFADDFESGDCGAWE